MTDTPAPGAAPALDLQTAIALADANQASGFPPPPHVQEVIEAASAADVKAARKAMDARRRAAEAEAAQTAAEPAPASAGEDQPTSPPAAAGADQPKE